MNFEGLGMNPAAVLLMVGGTLFATIGIALIVQTILFLIRSRSAKAVVIGHDTRTDIDSVIWFVPKVVFSDSTGERRESLLQTAAVSVAPELKEGDTIEVLYDPANPSRIRTREWSDLWRGIIPLFIGLGCLFGGLAGFNRE